MPITTLSQAQQQQILITCQDFINRANALYDQTFSTPEVVFDLKGKAAGMYQVKKVDKKTQRRIRINPWLAAKYFDETLTDTVPHEVAHFVVDSLYGLKRVRPHGTQWKSVMLDFGVEPNVRGTYSLEGIPTKQYQRFEYACACQRHFLTIIRHKKILAKKAKYRCRHCDEELVVV